MVLCQKTLDCPLQLGGELQPRAKELKYLVVFFTSDGKVEHKMDRLSGAASLILQTLHWTVVVKRELNQKVKLSI